MNLEVEAYEGELRELRKLSKILKHEVMAEKLGEIYFICGEGGEKDQNNLPKRIHICPAYGVDFFVVYTKTDQVVGPEW